MDKRTKDKKKRSLSSTQEVLYAREFHRADRAGGYVNRNSKH
ncbi:YfhE family protein [Bacillus sp. FJAT-29790]|nr:YfhE family protein [Bacillus sp. FJAT-29790]MBU8880590.1 YfhE family protein [Bacillus sp. FJAT-29790]